MANPGAGRREPTNSRRADGGDTIGLPRHTSPRPTADGGDAIGSV